MFTRKKKGRSYVEYSEEDQYGGYYHGQQETQRCEGERHGRFPVLELGSRSKQFHGQE